MGGLSFMSVTVIMAVAVLERPKFRLPSMSVACTIIVYWDTFCEGEKKDNSVVSVQLKVQKQVVRMTFLVL